MKIGTMEKEIIGTALVSFLVGWYCATHQFSWETLWLLGMSVSFGLFITATNKRPLSTGRIWYSICLLCFYLLLGYVHFALGK